MLDVRRAAGPLAALALAVALIAAIFVSARNAAFNRSIVTVHGVVGSEKADFFKDPDVIAEFKKNGIVLNVDSMGSREQATEATMTGADFYFPAGEPAGRALAKRLGVHVSYNPFFSPMVVVSWEPIAKILQANGAVHRSGRFYIADMPALLRIIESQKRWSDLRDSSAYSTGKSVLIESTDVRKSNSAAMYASLASYIFNGNNIVSNPAQANRVQSKIDDLFVRQGFQETSSAGPFDDYVTIGMGKAPLVIVYEQQFIEYEVQNPPQSRAPGMVVLYPNPTIFTKHTLIPTNSRGDHVGKLLQDDPVLRALEIRHGFRNSDTAQMLAFWRSQHLDVNTSLIDVIDPPSFEVLEHLIDGVSRAYNRQAFLKNR